MLSFPNSKINIGLYITQKREDGYHNLETVFYPIDLCDALEFSVSDNESLSFTNSGLIIDAKPEDNIVVQAYNILKKNYDLPVIDIHLHKHIPFGAGLGGGSADAAYMIKSLNTFFDLALSDVQMQEYAAILGSDCSFFIKNKACYAYEKGDKFKDIDLDLNKYTVVLIKPDVNISTAEAYAGIHPCASKHSLLESIQKPIEQWKDLIFNDFETSLFPKYPILKNIKDKLYHMGAIYASMSGSGSSIYGIFAKNTIDTTQFEDCFVWSDNL